MITAIDLYGCNVNSRKCRQRVRIANETAKSIFEKRNESPWVEELPKDITYKDIEQYVIKSLREVEVKAKWIN